ncbi:MAG: ornithine cyclodeaminase family protein [bacterium]
MTLIIGEATTKKLIDMRQALKAVEAIFRNRAAGAMRSLPRRRLKGRQRQLNVMAAWHARWDLFCLRAYVGRANTVTLYHGRTGEIAGVVNMKYLSSLRTGAASGVAAKYLAPSKSEVLGLIGPGWQGTFQIEAIAQSAPIRRVLVFGRNPKKRKAFIGEMRRKVSVDWKEAASLEEIEAESDIVVLATDSTVPIIDGSRLKDEALVITMGANAPARHEVSPDLVRRMNLVVTDDPATAQTGSGDLIDAAKEGALRWEEVVALEKIVAEGAPLPRPPRILFQSNGIADEDLAVARYVFEQVKRKKVGVRKISEI